MADDAAQATRIVTRGTLAELRAYYGTHGATLARAETLVSYAVQRRDQKEIMAIVRFLVETVGLSHDYPDENSLRQTPLFFAARHGLADVSSYLLERQASANASDGNAQTPLFYAARYGHVPCVRLLLEARGDKHSRDVNGQTAAFYAARDARSECMQILLEGADRAVANACDCWGRTALFYVADDTCSRQLLEKNCGPNVRDLNEQSALFFAARNGHEGAVSVMIEWRAEVDIRDRNRQTPLFYAADAGHVGTCRLLIEKNADPHSKDVMGQTPTLVATGARDSKRADSEIRDFFRSFTNGGRARKAPKSTPAPKKKVTGAAAAAVAKRQRTEEGICEAPVAATPSTTGKLGGSPRAVRRRYCIVFDDPRNPGTAEIPFETKEYEEALRGLAGNCPWLRLDLWPPDAPLTKGPV